VGTDVDRFVTDAIDRLVVDLLKVEAGVTVIGALELLKVADELCDGRRAVVEAALPPRFISPRARQNATSSRAVRSAAI